jgi:ribosomal protein L16 Arg81 hydroxylase
VTQSPPKGTAVIDCLLGDASPSAFLEQHYLKFPLAHGGGAAQFAPLGSWRTVEAILDAPDVDVMVVRQGTLIKTDAILTYDQARAHHASGCTLVIRNSQRHHVQLQELANGFQQTFRAPVDIHIYCTPAGQSGFGWHYDAEDVFILQTEGSKEYSLRKNTVHPWPLVETIPADMHYEREITPIMCCTLAAGDWLYIPTGYWHKAQAADLQQESISLAIGVMSTSAIDVFDFLRPRLLASLLWRQRLPTAGPVAPINGADQITQLRSIFTQLGEDLARMMCDEQLLTEFLASRVNRKV